MNQRIMRAERNENGDLWKRKLAEHEKRPELEHSAAAKREACGAGTDMRRVKSSQHFEEKALCRKAAKSLAQSPI